MAHLYKDYFNIDENYYAAVTADLIKQGKVSWKKFYPHETFVRLLETTYRVLSGQAHRSIWVEGAYGTGKSHAALTVKSLLEAPEADVREYFEDFGLSRDLMEKYLSLQRSGNMLVVHRIGSSDIVTDMDLIMAVQESILAALKEHGIEKQGAASMREAFLAWVEKPAQKEFFASIIQDPKYTLDFGGMTADHIVEKLKNSSYEEAAPLMAKVMPVLKDNGVYGLFTSADQMATWIENIIQSNHLQSILFIWDEFSEFFINHPTGLTGFQTLIEISAAQPFYFMIVAHESQGLFKNAKDTAKKIMDRFEDSVKIELPENMAFKLMAQAMKITDDVVLREDWESDRADLNDELVKARQYIVDKSARQSGLGKKTHLSDEELQAIVPMHPYGALLLKHIATVFNSNQRSMFDFIISNDMTDAKGFKWFINHFSSESDTNLLTIDLLWDFFCGKQKRGLNDDVRGILDTYNTMKLDKLTEDEKRVIKTILLFQAISLHVLGNELLAPNAANLEMAFSGSGWDWIQGKVLNIIHGLVNQGLVFEKSLPGGQKEYVVANGGSQQDLGAYRAKAEKLITIDRLITDGDLLEAIAVPASLKGRYQVGFGAGAYNFTKVFMDMKRKVAPNRFKVLTTFAILDDEDRMVEQKIQEKLKDMEEGSLIVRTLTPMGRDLREQYLDALTFCLYNEKKDKAQAQHYEDQAHNVLANWKSKIANGAFMVYTTDTPNGQRMANIEDLQQFFKQWDNKIYYYGVDQYELTDTLYGPYQLATGALCGITEKLNNAYRISNKNRSFENALRGAWGVPEYWKKPENRNLSVVKIKNVVDDLIDKGFQSQAGRVSMLDIWQTLTDAPYGLMANSVSALVLGFVLKEYVNSQYFWSNGSITEVMTPARMKEMIAKAMNGNMEGRGAKTEYIVSMTPEVRKFLDGTTRAFAMSGKAFGSVEETASHLCVKVKGFAFPLWTVKYVLDETPISCDKKLVEEVIDAYSGIFNGANVKNGDASRLAEQIGKSMMDHPTLADDLALLCSSQKTMEGMQRYVADFQDGVLPKLAQKIVDGGKYMQRIKAGFSAEEANWLWNQGTADRIISDVILEYQIIAESKKCLVVASSFDSVISRWSEKVNQIKIPCSVLKMKVGALGDFLQLLLSLSQTRSIQDKKIFYHLLTSEGESFKEFYGNQFTYFKAAVAEFADDLDEEGLQKLFLDLPTGQFGKSSTEYFQMINDRVKAMMQNEIRAKLAKLWQQKTGSKTPRDWSYEHKTPILCLFDDEEREKAKKYLPLIGQSNALTSEVKEAIEYLEKADFYDKMKDQAYMDQRFMDLVVGDCTLLLKDPDTVREALFGSTVAPYDWWNNVSVTNKIKTLFNRGYHIYGRSQAEQVLASMDADQLRGYLRDKLEDPDFGMQILKGRK